MLKVNMFLQYWYKFLGGLKKNKMKKMARIKEIQRQRMVNGKVYSVALTPSRSWKRADDGQMRESHFQRETNLTVFPACCS